MKYKQCVAACVITMLSCASSPAFSATETTGQSEILLQTETSWKLPAKPLDIVYSLDGKLVFILTNQSQVLVYKADGSLLNKIDVAKGVSSIDIAPRGEKLYLINQKDNSFTVLSIDFVVSIDTTGSPFLGKENAPVTIAVFTDFE